MIVALSFTLNVMILFYFKCINFAFDTVHRIFSYINVQISVPVFDIIFPQLVVGPIERSKNLLKQLAAPCKFNFESAREGFLLMLWGYFLKIVLADRIALFVDTVYGDYIVHNYNVTDMRNIEGNIWEQALKR